MNPAFEFDDVPERRGTGCAKWDDAPALFHAPDVLPLWVADMDFSAPPAVLDALKRRVEHGVFGYPASRQDPTRDALAGWLHRRHGWSVPDQDIVFAPGVVPSLQAALEAFSEPGDEILVQPPVYHPFFDLARTGGRILTESPLVELDGRWTMDLDDLERKAETAEVLLLCHPHNPVGRCWTRDELEAVCRICARTGTMVLSDEIHSDLVFSPSRHIPLASLGILAPDRIATFVAPSKTFNLAGLNLSAAILPDASRRAAFQRVFRDRGIPCTSAMGLVAAEAAWSRGDAWLDALLVYLDENMGFIESVVRDRCPGLRMTRPEATYLAWLDGRELGMGGAELARWFAREAKVGLNGGSMFGVGGEGWVRLNFGTSRALLELAMGRIAEALERRCAGC